MQPVPQDLLKEYVQSQHFTSTTEIMEAMKEIPYCQYTACDNNFSGRLCRTRKSKKSDFS